MNQDAAAVSNTTAAAFLPFQSYLRGSQDLVLVRRNIPHYLLDWTTQDSAKIVDRRRVERLVLP